MSSWFPKYLILLMVSHLSTAHIYIGNFVLEKPGDDVANFLSDMLQEELAHCIPVEPDLPLSTRLEVHIGVGRSPYTLKIIEDQEIITLHDDGYIIKVKQENTSEFHKLLIAVRGTSSRANSYGGYALLRLLGFGFLHPMKVVRPNCTTIDVSGIIKYVGKAMKKEPIFSIRGSHVHAEHPNELCNVLNGFDANGKYSDRTAWSKLLPEFSQYLKWILANGQSHVEWSLLSAKAFSDFIVSNERLLRLKQLTMMAKAYGLSVGIDAPFTQTQEHGFRLLYRDNTTSEEEAWGLVKERVDWLLQAGFDYINSELGTTEISHTKDMIQLMSLLNRTMAYMDGANAEFHIENHISQGQTIPGFPDPLNPTKDINFNWITYYLDHRITSRPHTVQVYNLIDPAPTYGNSNFTFMLDFVELMLKAKRDVIWYPELAYWCNYDISVPLFLPLYALSRLTDLQLISDRAEKTGYPLKGQILFESGWQWGYWLHNVVAMAGQWRETVTPDYHFSSLVLQEKSPLELFHSILLQILEPLARNHTKVVGLADVLTQITYAQHELLVLGKYNVSIGLQNKNFLRELGVNSDLWMSKKNISMVSGMDYLIGFDAIADILFTFQRDGIVNSTTQPNRLPIRDLIKQDTFTKSFYRAITKPVLSAMAQKFTFLSEKLSNLTKDLQLDSSFSYFSASGELLLDLDTSMKLLMLRSIQMKNLYEYADVCGGVPIVLNCGAKLLEASRDAINHASKLIPAQELGYGLFANGSKRLWAYGDDVNPTAYGFGHLWTVHTLYYWRRDQAIVENRIMNPCFANIQNPLDILLGDGSSDLQEKILREIKKVLSHLPYVNYLIDCIAQPENPPFINGSLLSMFL